jgi:hypothetical protein
VSTKDTIKCLLAFVFVAAIIGAAVMGVSPRKIFALMISVVFWMVVLAAGMAGDGGSGGYP